MGPAFAEIGATASCWLLERRVLAPGSRTTLLRRRNAVWRWRKRQDNVDQHRWKTTALWPFDAPENYEGKFYGICTIERAPYVTSRRLPAVDDGRRSILADAAWPQKVSADRHCSDRSCIRTYSSRRGDLGSRGQTKQGWQGYQNSDDGLPEGAGQAAGRGGCC